MESDKHIKLHTKVIVNRDELSEVKGIIRGYGVQFKDAADSKPEGRFVYLVEISEGDRLGNGGELIIAGKSRGFVSTIVVTPEFITEDE